MKKGKNSLITLGIIIAIIILAFIILKKPQGTDAEVAKCIGENSIVYSQEGCIHCIQQYELFGENKKYLNIFDCLDDGWKTCSELGIPGTPTWIIDDQKYIGKQSIEKLKELTGC